MASVAFQKFKNVSDLKAVFRHDAPDTRLQMNHGNKQINKELTHLNTSYYEYTSYADVCFEFDERLELLDRTTNTNKRKDRVICMGLVIPLPEGVPSEQSEEWMQKAGDVLADFYGDDNLIEGFIHRDEVHDYIDAVTKAKRTSSIHGQFYIVPEHEGKLNGKWFSSKTNMIKVNEEIDKMSREYFGVPFLKRNGQKSHGKTEDLKFLSGQLAAEKLAEAEERLKMAVQKEDEINSRLMALEAQERASKVEREKLYIEADKALKTAHSVSDDWGLTDAAIKILKNKRVRKRKEDGTTESVSYYDDVQNELQRQAAAHEQRQVAEHQRQVHERAVRERKQAEKTKKFGDVVRSGGTGTGAASTSTLQYDNPFEP